MRKVALFCTLFVLLSSGYAQSNRVGIYATPQYCFFKQGGFFDKSVKGKGFAFNGGAFYEINWGIGISFGVGYTQMNTHFTENDVETKHNRGFVSVPISAIYEYEITDKILIGFHGMAGFSYLVSSKQFVAGIETPANAEKKLYLLGGFGLNFTYLFTDEIGLSVMPTFSGMFVINPDYPTYWGAGAQIRFFYAFGY